jgi:hypothetical protein
MRTDWDAYYHQPIATSKYSRRITARILENLIRRFCDQPLDTVVELGGGNSCFVDGIRARFKPRRYCVIDNNEVGLQLLSGRFSGDASVFSYNRDVLHLGEPMGADLVFSVGLIEHFCPPDTRRAILAHFALLRPGGVAIITFPTPTLLYRASRFVSESLGLWQFPDERPLDRHEVLPSVRQQGQILFEAINWPIFFTQMIVAARQA